MNPAKYVLAGGVCVALIVSALWLYFCTPDVFYGFSDEQVQMHIYGIVMVGIHPYLALGDITIPVTGRWVIVTLPMVPRYLSYGWLVWLQGWI